MFLRRWFLDSRWGQAALFTRERVETRTRRRVDSRIGTDVHVMYISLAARVWYLVRVGSARCRMRGTSVLSMYRNISLVAVEVLRGIVREFIVYVDGLRYVER